MITTLPNGHIVDSQSDFSTGITDYSKSNEQNGYAFGRSIDYRSDPNALQLLPKTVKESGSVITDLPLAGDLVDTDFYYYGDTGNIYKRTSAGSHSLLRSVAGSSGNGMRYYSEDDFLYYTRDKVIGRYGQISGTPTFVDDFLGSEGGVPLNTYALDLEAGSSQYASRADTASLSITGDLAIECSIKPESLPTAGNSMVLFSKWDVNTNLRSYKFEIYAVSGYFGDGSDGALTVSSNTTESPIDSACTGTLGTTSLSATNASFAAGQIILIHQTQGTGAGTWEKNKISSYTTGTITTENALSATYSSGAQVRVLPQYSNVTINSGITYTAKAWNGTVGGILAFLYNGTLTVTGNISANGKGFRGGTGSGNVNIAGTQGESTTGTGSVSSAANGMGGGGAGLGTGNTSDGGGGGGHSATGGTGSIGSAGGIGGTGGGTGGSADLTTMVFGGAGGGPQCDSTPLGQGGNSGGIIYAAGVTLTVSGAITANGDNGQNTAALYSGPVCGGGGAGGSILLKAQTATLGSSIITATGGSGSIAGTVTAGGNGSDGRIHLDYLTSYTGTTTPTLNVTQDNNLVTNTTYQLRLGLSSNGTAEEFLARATTITTGEWFHVGVSWDASDSQAEFFQDGVSLGSATGAVTSLNNNASVAGLGADFNSTARNFYDGLIDEVRVWNTERTAAQMLVNKGVEIADNAAGLVAYYQLDNDYTDSQTSGLNDLTASNSPVFTTDVPFSSPTAREDLDQSLDTSGNTYTTPTAISESSTARQSFVPTKDPQKSIEVLIAAIGTGNWTLTVHDSLNRTVASKTVTNANLNTGDFEFIFDTVWRPIIGATYHFHLTSTVADGTVTTTTASDLETVDFHTYYQFLVEDAYHPIEQFLNFLVIGNERYVAKYAADGTYEPHKLTLPAGWRIRSIAKWREYVVFGCFRETNIYDTDKGLLIFWNGYSSTYDFFVEVPEGGINALFAAKGKLYVFAGYHGDMYIYQGGDSVVESETKRVPLIEEDEYIEIYPNAVTMWGALLRWGVGGNSDAASVERGVYTWGRRKSTQPISLSYDYPISTESRATTNVKMGLLFPVGKKLLIGWKDNTAYGMDVVDPTTDPFATGTIELNIEDAGAVWKQKKTVTYRVDFQPLNSGESVKLKYKLDRADSWTEGATDNENGYATTDGDTYARINIPRGDARELQIAIDLATSVSTSPKILGVAVEQDLNKNQSIV